MVSSLSKHTRSVTGWSLVGRYLVHTLRPVFIERLLSFLLCDSCIFHGFSVFVSCTYWIRSSSHAHIFLSSYLPALESGWLLADLETCCTPFYHTRSLSVFVVSCRRIIVSL